MWTAGVHSWIYYPDRESYINESAPAVNYEGSNEILAGVNDSDSYTAYFHFNLTEKPYYYVNSLNLRLLISSPVENESDCSLLITDNQWEENSLNWLNKPMDIENLSFTILQWGGDNLVFIIDIDSLINRDEISFCLSSSTELITILAEEVYFKVVHTHTIPLIIACILGISIDVFPVIYLIIIKPRIEKKRK